MPARLGVNVDHVATLRQVRRAAYPDPVAAAIMSELAGADQITIHLREDRRHIQDRDLQVLRKTVTSRLNLEMAVVPEMLRIAYEVKPDMVTLVPERREELTTEGGLDVVGGREGVRKAVKTLRDAEVEVSLFIDPDLDQVKASHRAEVAFVVLDGYQGKGIGAELLTYLTFLAKKQGLLGFAATVLQDNKPMLHLFESMGFEIEKRLDAGTYEMVMSFKEAGLNSIPER